jgi:hypothetical protein
MAAPVKKVDIVDPITLITSNKAHC